MSEGGEVPGPVSQFGCLALHLAGAGLKIPLHHLSSNLPQTVNLQLACIFFTAIIVTVLGSLRGPDNVGSIEQGRFCIGHLSQSLCILTNDYVFPEGSVISARRSSKTGESEWEGGCSCLYIYCIRVRLCVCTPLRSHLVWRSRRMYKVPFMLWSPLYLPRHQPGRYDVHNIFTFNFKLIFSNLFYFLAPLSMISFLIWSINIFFPLSWHFIFLYCIHGTHLECKWVKSSCHLNPFVFHLLSCTL